MSIIDELSGNSHLYDTRRFCVTTHEYAIIRSSDTCGLVLPLHASLVQPMRCGRSNVPASRIEYNPWTQGSGLPFGHLF